VFPGCLLTPVFVGLGLLWCVFPSWGMWPFFALETATMLWPVSALPVSWRAAAGLRAKCPDALVDEEWAYFRKHVLLFLYPYATRSLSGTLSAVCLLKIPVGVVLLVRAAWIGVGLCFADYFVCGMVAKFLCPTQFVTDRYARDPAFWAAEKRKLDRCMAFAHGLHTGGGEGQAGGQSGE